MGSCRKEAANILSERAWEIARMPKGWVMLMIAYQHIWTFNLPGAQEIRLTHVCLSLRGRVTLSGSRMWQKDIGKFRPSYVKGPTCLGTAIRKPHLWHSKLNIILKNEKSRGFPFSFCTSSLLRLLFWCKAWNKKVICKQQQAERLPFHQQHTHQHACH